MWLFGGGSKGGKGGGSPSRSRMPTARVMSLSSQGVSEPEIIRTLKDEGYSPLQVDQAMKEALKSTVGAGGMPPMGPPPAPAPLPGEPEMAPPMRRDLGPDVPTLPPLPTETERAPMADPFPPAESPDTMMPQMPEQGLGGLLPGEEPIPKLREPMTGLEKKEDRRRALEELAESIIEEKWAGLKEELINLKSAMGETNLKVASLEQIVTSIKGEKKTDMEHIEEKIDTYRTSINQVSAKMEAIERAMKDSLNPMMQSMRSLTETIRTMKSKPSQ